MPKTMLVVLVTLLGVPPALAGQARAIGVELTEGTNLAAALSPDGRTLAIDLLGRIWTLPVDGGSATAVTDELGDARQPAWSPDGRRIAFQSYRDGTWHIWSVASDGSDPRRHTIGEFDHREPQFAPDGRSLVFSSDRSGNYDVWRLDLATGRLEQLTDDPADDFGPAVSPDGAAIAFVSTRRAGPGIWVRAADGSTQPWTNVAGQLSAPSWSPDGRQIAFNLLGAGESRLAVATRGAVARPVTAPGQDAFPFRAAWTAGDELLYTADGKILRQRLGATEQQPIPFRARVTLDRPAYSRAVRDFDGTAPEPVLGIVSPAVSPDGRTVAFVALGDLWLLRDGRPARLTDDPFVESDPQWSPDGRWLAFAADRSGGMELWLRDVAAGTERQLTSGTDGAALPSWSPDGTRIVFQAQQGLGTAIRQVTVATGAITTLRDNLFQPSRATWAPDGVTLAVAALRANSSRFREGRNDILVLTPGGADRWVTLPSGRGIAARGIDGPVWSPDGRQMAYVSDGLLWAMPVTPAGEPAGPAVRLSSELANSISWTGDSRAILYQTTRGLRRVALATGATERIDVPLTWRRRNPARRIVVHAGRMWNGIADATQAGVDVVIQGHRIAEVVPHSAALHRDSVVDGSRYTLMPGLADAHAHLGYGTGEALGRIWLAYGITTIRDPAADPFVIRERREAVESGVRVGPRELATGRIFDGDRIYYGFNNAITPGDQLTQELDRAADLGFDFIKTYVRLSDVLQRRIVAFAHDHGMAVSSHELYPAVAFGADHVEHIRGTSRRGYSPKVSGLLRSYQDVVALLAASGMTLTPTIGIQGGFFDLVGRDPSLLDDPRLALGYGPAYVEGLRARAAAPGRRPGGPQAPIVASQGETVRRVIAGGGRVIAGTDAPIVPYGLSLHTELQHFVDGGLTPVQALRTATSGFADAMGLAGHTGSIAAGRLADLVLVDGDPTRRIADARRVRVVIKNGEVYTVEDLLEGAMR